MIKSILSDENGLYHVRKSILSVENALPRHPQPMVFGDNWGQVFNGFATDQRIPTAMMHIR